MTMNKERKTQGLQKILKRLANKIVLPMFVLLFFVEVSVYDRTELAMKLSADEVSVAVDERRRVRDDHHRNVVAIDDDDDDDGKSASKKYSSSGERRTSNSNKHDDDDDDFTASGAETEMTRERRGNDRETENSDSKKDANDDGVIYGERCVASIRDGHKCERFSLTAASVVDVKGVSGTRADNGRLAKKKNAAVGYKCDKRGEEDSYLDDGGGSRIVDGMKIDCVPLIDFNSNSNSGNSSSKLDEAMRGWWFSEEEEEEEEEISAVLTVSGAKYQKAVVVIDGTQMSSDEASKLAESTKAAQVFVAYGTREKFNEQNKVASVLVAGPGKNTDSGSAAHRLASILLSKGVAVLILSDKNLDFTANPLESDAFLYYDGGKEDEITKRRVGFDLELAVDTTCRGSGQIIGIGDKSMGWSQYAQSVCLPMARSSFMRFNPSFASIELCRYFGEHLDVSRIGVDDRVTKQVIMPAYDNTFKAGARLKPLRQLCRYSLKQIPNRGSRYVPSVSAGRDDGDELSGDPNAIIPSQKFDNGRSFALGDENSDDVVNKHKQCERSAWSEESGPHPRKLRYIVPWSSSRELELESWPANCDGGSEKLCEVVKKVAINREVLVGVSNSNIFHMLQLWIDGLQKTEITNYMIVALDERTAKWCEEHNAPYYLRSLTSISGSTDNHATSGLKFEILKEFLKIGVNVLLSDVDIVWMRDPFKNDLLYRDTDVEGMSDGWDDRTTYGFRWSPTRGGNRNSADELTYRMFVKNSGLFFTQATYESLQMMTVLASRMSTERSTWDQTAYNEEHTFLSDIKTPTRNSASSRIMNFACFCNSKYVFKYMRYDEKLYPEQKFHPASIHVNYHPEKPQRMLDIIKQYWKGEKDAIMRWNGGEGMASSVQCKKRPAYEDDRKTGIQQSELAKAVANAHTGKWGGISGIEWKESGVLVTPWGQGTWGVIPGTNGNELFMDWGPTHELKGTIDGGTVKLSSKRCPDGDIVPSVIADGL